MYRPQFFFRTADVTGEWYVMYCTMHHISTIHFASSLYDTLCISLRYTLHLSTIHYASSLYDTLCIISLRCSCLSTIACLQYFVSLLFVSTQADKNKCCNSCSSSLLTISHDYIYIYVFVSSSSLACYLRE